MAAPFPTPIKSYHMDTYPAIDPASPRLSTKGKNVVITGGGSGIGTEITRAFAVSGASSISIFGRTAATLLETKSRLETEYPQTRILTYVADIVDKSALVSAFDSIKRAVGPIDVLVANAGYLPHLRPIAETDFEDWYKGFEVNVKGNFNLITAFLPYAKKDAAVINISTGMTHLQYVPGYSSYHTSKLAAAKFFEYLHYEHPDLFVLNVHPGVIQTGMAAKAKEGGTNMPIDEIALPADFVNWAVSEEAKQFNGKFLWAHWDVEELVARKDEIVGTNNFEFALKGWPAL